MWGIPYVVAVSSGTAAMHLAMRLLGVGSGDEVIASSLTFIGSVTPVVFEGAVPVFIDCDQESWNMDPGLLKGELERCEKRGNLPKAVVPTDLYGHCVDYERIFEICGEYGVPVVADAAEALGAKYKLATDPHRLTQTGIDFSPADFAGEKVSSHTRADNLTRYRHAGVGAKAAVFSFNGNQIITTSGGGMLASDDNEFIDYARNLSQQARDPFPHYEHTEIGYNYRMSNILAPIGRGQLKVLDERVKRKREIFDYYREALGNVPGIEFMPEASYGKSNRWLTVILITPEEFGADRETVRLALEEENIEARPVWKPMHLQPVFDIKTRTEEKLAADTHRLTQTFSLRTSQRKNSYRFAGKIQNKPYKARMVGGQVAEDLFERGLCLPSGTAMTEEDLDRVVKVIRGCRK
ncbi:DegT/DnrJ/EryC1/StrS family aminotransferase [candidate division WOR-3 bacterium]|nr:DegT/DnrJ/EryC1/StrS family aminotransferase [candidate division WOR-3 bacterium]